MTKPTKWHVRPTKTQISLGIPPVWSESSLTTWRKLGFLATHWAHSEDSDQTGWMPRLIWVFTGRTIILLVLSWGGSDFQGSLWLLQYSRVHFKRKCLPKLTHFFFLWAGRTLIVESKFGPNLLPKSLKCCSASKLGSLLDVFTFQWTFLNSSDFHCLSFR